MTIILERTRHFLVKPLPSTRETLARLRIPDWCEDFQTLALEAVNEPLPDEFRVQSVDLHAERATDSEVKRLMPDNRRLPLGVVLGIIDMYIHDRTLLADWHSSNVAYVNSRTVYVNTHKTSGFISNMRAVERNATQWKKGTRFFYPAAFEA